MSNLIDELGVDYFNNRFYRSFFLDDDGRPSMVVATQGRHAVKVNTLVEDRVEEKVLRRSFFKDMNVFATPALGWRCREQGQVLYHMTRNNRSYHRGITIGNLHVVNHGITSALGKSVPTSRSSRGEALELLTVAKDILLPEFTPFHEGIAKLRDGEIISFAVSPHISVAANEEGGADVMFALRLVGKVDENGNLDCNIPTISMLLEEEE